MTAAFDSKGRPVHTSTQVGQRAIEPFPHVDEGPAHTSSFMGHARQNQVIMLASEGDAHHVRARVQPQRLARSNLSLAPHPLNNSTLPFPRPLLSDLELYKKSRRTVSSKHKSCRKTRDRVVDERKYYA